MEAGRGALEAVEAHDADGVLTSGGEIYLSCENCHARYWRQ
jgi:hypothetical protein